MSKPVAKLYKSAHKLLLLAWFAVFIWVLSVVWTLAFLVNQL